MWVRPPSTQQHGQVPLESYTFYTRSGKLKTWVRIPPCLQYILTKLNGEQQAVNLQEIGSIPIVRAEGCEKPVNGSHTV